MPFKNVFIKVLSKFILPEEVRANYEGEIAKHRGKSDYFLSLLRAEAAERVEVEMELEDKIHSLSLQIKDLEWKLAQDEKGAGEE